MTEPMADEAAPAAGSRTAGALLREARQARGMHIAALAAAIKVTPRKLEALENDRYEELVDATFTRALAQAVCRALKIDAEPVLALLPHTAEKGLNVSSGLNAPLRQRGLRRDNGDRFVLSRPVVWGSAVLVLGAVAVYFLPANLLTDRFGPAPSASAPVIATAPAASATPSAAPAVAPAVPGSAAAMPQPAPQAFTTPAAPASSPAAPAAAASASAGTDLVVRALGGASWLEVQDANGKMLISRLVAEGESVSLAGPTPLRVKIGNAPAIQMSFRGEPVPLARDKTLVRLELK